ncbi:Multi antimicrobial extrusion protein (Na(+)/drug antiporter) [Anaerovibrio sp. JC8]|uniref:MATE family efflux transporter n=1 Tax=Anaerovibrio sp. JC8 TaxID=1240085 RepID=UPI000A0A7D5A|nr:MATE family efflux transporter [Anaerovibrio sp. JC8]ORT99973.1 Multi antimicrobial extrusion protein (Na(+)/drug antiporter) [Anaerovibrio sp. JC8]
MSLLSILRKKTVISTRFRSVFVSAMVAMTLSYILMLSDNIVAGQFIDDDAVAAMSLVFPLLTILFFVSYLIADGLGMMAAYAQGQEDREKVNRLFSQGIMLSVGLGLVLSLLLSIFREQLLSFWEISPAYMAYARGYYDGLKWLPPVVFLNILFYTFLIQEGEEQVCVRASSIAFVANIISDIILCKALGTIGIGLGTVAGTTISCVVQCAFLFSEKSQLEFVWYCNFREIVRSFAYSFYHSADTLYLSMLPLVFSSYVIAHWGESHIIVVTVITNVLVLAIALYTGVVDCLQPMVCQYHSEGSYSSVSKTMELGIACTVIMSLLVAIGVGVFAFLLPLLFGVDEDYLIAEIVASLRCVLIFLVFLGPTLIYSNYYIYIEERNYGLILKTMLLLVFPILGMLLGTDWGMEGMWLGVGAGYLLAFLFNLLITRLWPGRGNILLLNRDKMARQYSYDINAVMEEVMNLSYSVRDELKAWGLPKSKILRLSLLVEEVGLNAVERAQNKPVQLEFSFLLEDAANQTVKLIARDNGKPYDVLSVVNEGQYSFRDYFIDSVTKDFYRRKYLSAGDENKLVFEMN